MMINGYAAIESMNRYTRASELASFAREMGNVHLALSYEDRAAEALSEHRAIMAALSLAPVDNAAAG